MRILSCLALAALLSAPAVSAQTSLRLVDPLLSVDGARVGVAGAPIMQSPFGVLTIRVPGTGTYAVSERPFAGARRAGQFDGRGLFFASEGRSVRMVSREPILSLDGPVSAYVRFTPSTSRARGMASVAVADDLSGRGQRSVARAPAPRTVRTSGPRPRLTDRPASRFVRRGDQSASEVSRLRSELSRLVADRERMAADRDRIARERDEARRRVAAGATESQVLAQQSRRIVALETERARLIRERNELAAARDRTENERARMAEQFGQIRTRAEMAEARVAGWSSRSQVDDARTTSELYSLRSERDALRAEVARIRGEIEARDRAVVMLRDEQTERESRLPAVASDLATARRQMADAVAERDRAYAARDQAYVARDAAVAQADGLRAERDALRVQMAQSPDAPAPLPDTAGLDAERAALARDRALLDADRAALAAERDALEAMRAPATGTPAPADAADRQALLDQLAAAQSERELLLAEQQALMDERDRLAAEVATLRDRRFRPPTPADPPRTIRTPTEAGDGAVAYLPGFDFADLSNPDVIRRRLDEAEYPRWATVGRIEGDVMVLYETDSSGRVIRTAVPTPIGGGLDALAEEIVREMRFAPGDGRRSQVTVRFNL